MESKDKSKSNKRTNENNEPTNSNNRRDRYQKIANDRAAHFARSQPSSTPTGMQSITIDSVQSEWCGPFSTANHLLQQRETVKIARESALSANKETNLMNESKELDIYDSYLKSLCLTSNRDFQILSKPVGTMKSLVDLCLEVIANNFESVEELGELSPLLNSKLAHLLSQRRKLSNEAVTMLAHPGSSSLILPECSSISEDTFVSIIKKCSNICSGELYPATLKVLQLDNCGHGFTDRTVQTILPHLVNLEVLHITGCYKLSDTVLQKAIEKIPNLRHLNISTNSRLGIETLMEVSTLKKLSHINISNSFQLKGFDITFLKNLNCLQYLKLANINDLIDSDLEPILSKLGKLLKCLDISGCHKLSDKTLSLIHQNCFELVELDISSLPSITKTGLMELFVNTTPDGVKRAKHNVNFDSLETVRFKNLTFLDDELFILIAKLNQNKLKHIDISGCGLLSDKSMAALKIHCSSSLLTLDISFIRKVNESVLIALVSSCLYLQNIQIWGCSQINISSLNFYKGSINNF